MQFRHARGASSAFRSPANEFSRALTGQADAAAGRSGRSTCAVRTVSASRPRLHDQFSANHVEALSHAGKTEPFGAFGVVEALAGILDPEAQDEASCDRVTSMWAARLCWPALWTLPRDAVQAERDIGSDGHGQGRRS